jgi:hypothetical protein
MKGSAELGDTLKVTTSLASIVTPINVRPTTKTRMQLAKRVVAYAQ